MDRIPICYGYGRHSTSKQEMSERSESLMEQQGNCLPRGLGAVAVSAGERDE